MNINIKLGLRRIVIVFIGFIALLSLILVSMDIFDNSSYAYKENIKVTNIQDNTQVPFNAFIDEHLFLDEHGEKVLSIYIDCSPVTQLCTCDKDVDHKSIRNNDVLEFSNGEKFRIEMPSKINWNLRRIGQLIKCIFIILLSSFLVYLLYLGIEKLFIWIFKGFKEE